MPDNLSKMLTAVNLLDSNTELLKRSARIELKRMRSGHFRAFVACGPGTTADDVLLARRVLSDLQVSVNGFECGMAVTTVTIVDHAERDPNS